MITSVRSLPLAKHWREPYSKHKNLTVAMVLARMINWPPMLEAIGFPERWTDKYISHARKTFAKWKRQGWKSWSSAYVVTTCGMKIDKDHYVLNHVCNDVYDAQIYPVDGELLEKFWQRLRTINGLGAGFLAAQVVADLKNTYDNPLPESDDYWSWAVPGPGSRRGVNRYYGQPLNRKLKDDIWLLNLSHIRDRVQEKIPTYLRDSMCMQDWQNCMCEFDKYERVRNGEGRPRQNYYPA